MAEDPTLLLTHYVRPEAAEELRAALDGRLPPGALERATTPAETRAALPDVAGAVTLRFPADLLDLAPDLEWVQALSAGVDYYDRAALREAGVALTSAAGVHSEAVAEQVLAYLLAFERDLLTGLRQAREGVWRRYRGGELRGKTLGVIGLGAVGGRVADLGSALGMTVVGTKRDPATAPDAVDEALPAGEYWTVLRRAEYAVLACPLTDATRGLIGADELRALGGDGVLVNVARGPVVDQDALIEALQTGTLGGAALDVTDPEPLPSDSPLWDLPNAVVTPHVAGSTPEWAGRTADLIERNYAALTGDRPFENRVV